MDRIILHSDINSCYANIELLHHPELRGKPVAVAGRTEMRHGIILAKDELAKRCGVQTGMAIWQAQQLCPELVTLPPRMQLYARFSKYVNEIYRDYTDRIEPFGIDESWLDLTGCTGKMDGQTVAADIGRRIKDELGITVSIGVSWNKIFAKLGSDYKKPDAVTNISRENFRQLLWPLPVGELLCVGRSTRAKLKDIGVSTIGELAACDRRMLKLKLGKMGCIIHNYANGLDATPVSHFEYENPIKSIGNSTTCPRDLVCREDVRIVLLALAESVGARLRENGLSSRLVTVSMRGNDLHWQSHGRKLPTSTNITMEIFSRACALMEEWHNFRQPLRSLGINCSELSPANEPEQTDFFGISQHRQKQRELDAAIDGIRRRFGSGSIRRGLAGTDEALSGFAADDSHAAKVLGYTGNLQLAKQEAYI